MDRNAIMKLLFFVLIYSKASEGTLQTWVVPLRYAILQNGCEMANAKLKNITWVVYIYVSYGRCSWDTTNLMWNAMKKQPVYSSMYPYTSMHTCTVYIVANNSIKGVPRWQLVAPHTPTVVRS